MAATTSEMFEKLSKELKALHKDVRKIRALIEDPSGDKAAARAQNNGFNKPQEVSPELRAFLELGPTDTISRSQVTSKINQYAEANHLKKGQQITLDPKLQALMNVPEGVKLSFLNCQTYLKSHYIVQPKEDKPPKEPKVEAATKPKVSRPKVAKKVAEPPAARTDVTVA